VRWRHGSRSNAWPSQRPFNCSRHSTKLTTFEILFVPCEHFTVGAQAFYPAMNALLRGNQPVGEAALSCPTGES
jgi:hypothetical protein